MSDRFCLSIAFRLMLLFFCNFEWFDDCQSIQECQWREREAGDPEQESKPYNSLRPIHTRRASSLCQDYAPKRQSHIGNRIISHKTRLCAAHLVHREPPPQPDTPIEFLARLKVEKQLSQDRRVRRDQYGIEKLVTCGRYAADARSSTCISLK